MTLVQRNSLYRDPFALAREMLGFDPFSVTPARTQEATFVPAFEVVERADAYTVTADLPGVKEADLDVTLHDGQLVVSGTRQAEERAEGDSYYLYERRFGNFSRAFKLPDNADHDAIEAALEGGVLTIRVGKRESARPRKISLGQKLREKLGRA